MEERKRLLSEVSDDFSRAEDIAMVKRIKELEPLQDAWQEWSQSRQ